MGKKKDEEFQSAIRILAGSDAPRVWSLIVTVFGDLAQKQGDAISGPMLGDILSPVGVRPEAMRVALHRLRNEGWIETSKRGREALHRLSTTGLDQSSAASGRIYAPAQEAVHEWHVLCYPSVLSSDEHSRTGRFEKGGYVAIAPRVYLANGPLARRDVDALALEGNISDVPDWLSQSLAPRPLISAFKDLSAAIQLMDIQGEIVDGLTPCQIATLRALVVHRWRKLVLKLPNVPDLLFGAEFAGTICREHVMQALQQLPRPPLSSLTRSTLEIK